jgi:flagellar biogenesis protein FliO
LRKNRPEAGQAGKLRRPGRQPVTLLLLLIALVCSGRANALAPPRLLAARQPDSANRLQEETRAVKEETGPPLEADFRDIELPALPESPEKPAVPGKPAPPPVPAEPAAAGGTAPEKRPARSSEMDPGGAETAAQEEAAPQPETAEGEESDLPPDLGRPADRSPQRPPADPPPAAPNPEDISAPPAAGYMPRESRAETAPVEYAETEPPPLTHRLPPESPDQEDHAAETAAPDKAAQSAAPAEQPAWFQRHVDAWDTQEDSTGADQREAGTAGDSPAAQEEDRDLPGTGEGMLYYLRVIAALCFICAAIIFGGWLLRRYGRRVPALAGASLGTVLGTVHLSPKVSLHYVRSGGRILLIGVTSDSVSLITEFNIDDFENGSDLPESGSSPAPEENAPPGFLDQLRRSASRQTPPPADEEVDALRAELQRLKQFLRESAGENLDA